MNTDTILALASAAPTKSQFDEIYGKMLILSFFARNTTKYSVVKDGAKVIDMIEASAHTFSEAHGSTDDEFTDLVRGMCILLATEDAVEDAEDIFNVAAAVAFGVTAYSSAREISEDFDRLVVNALDEITREARADAEAVAKLATA